MIYFIDYINNIKKLFPKYCIKDHKVLNNMKMIYKVFNYLLWLIFEFIWFLKKMYPPPKSQINNLKYSIGITTYKDRFDNYFCTLIRRISVIFPDTEIIVAVNGHFDTVNQEIYLEKLKCFMEAYPSIKLIKYVSPQGLSKLWNQILLTITTDRVFILNDDINFSPFIRKVIEKTNFFEECIALINNSFSFFILSKELAKEMGGFDECFLEIGGEDTDFCVRMALKGYPYPPIYHFKYIQNYQHKPEVNSYGKKVVDEAYMYSTYNRKYLEKKWETRENYFEGSVFSCYNIYWKLKDGIETLDYL